MADELAHVLKGLALLRASHSSEIALAGSRRLCSTLAAAPVAFAHKLLPQWPKAIHPPLLEDSTRVLHLC